MNISVHMFLKFFTLTAAVTLLLADGFLFGAFAREKVDTKAEVESPALSVPDREIKYEETLSPDWKKNWDLARELYRQKKFREALVQYEFLLAEKENIEEARWEYATLLLHLERWKPAGEQLERLIDRGPDNRDYRLAMARVDIETGKIDLAVQLYEQLYNSAPDDTAIVPVLEGLIKALTLQKRNAEVIPYLEQLMTLQPADPELQMKLAELAMDQGQLDKADKILSALEQSRPDDNAVLQLQAHLQEKLGNSDAEAGYLQQLVANDPDNIEAHHLLFRYYYEQENWAMGLKHVEVLLKKTPNDSGLLEAAAELNIRAGRIDKALEYYNYILVVQPENKNILHKKKEAQKRLAEDLVVLVENNGCQQLWQDLVKVTSDRPGVYREIADLLREKGKTEELIEVLSLICLEDPHDDKTLKELTVMLKERGRNEELKAVLDKQKSTFKDNGLQ